MAFVAIAAVVVVVVAVVTVADVVAICCVCVVVGAFEMNALGSVLPMPLFPVKSGFF